MFRTAKFYLWFATSYYLILGVTLLIPIASLRSIGMGLAGVGTLSGFVSYSFLECVPLGFTGQPPDPSGLCSYGIPLLAVVAIIFSLLAVFFLLRFEKNRVIFHWIAFWGFLLVLSVIMSFVGLFSLNHFSPLMLGAFIHPALLLYSTYTLFQGYWQKTQGDRMLP